MIKDIAIGKMKSASNYVITFLKWALISIIIGVVGGCVGALFHMSVNYANIIFTMHDWFILFLPIGGIIIVAMYKACKMLENKGTDSIISSIRNDEKVPILLAPLIFVSTVITHLCGGSAGREGAALQLGGSIGSNIGRLFKLDEKDMHMVVMCGMSAVFSGFEPADRPSGRSGCKRNTGKNCPANRRDVPQNRPFVPGQRRDKPGRAKR